MNSNEPRLLVYDLAYWARVRVCVCVCVCSCENVRTVYVCVCVCKQVIGYKVFYKRSNHEESFRAVKINHKNLVK